MQKIFHIYIKVMTDKNKEYVQVRPNLTDTGEQTDINVSYQTMH